ncbi:Gfo/Idh/MocA family protein [Georgenia sp. AZ-5]|uniref:Gfo/Idh/MocA family protein n=1 Tax=Georgenia sp. AZ-5 TaxID=3367526 RepID=UPI003754732D
MHDEGVTPGTPWRPTAGGRTAAPPVRSGLVGAGFMGRVHAQAVRAAGGVLTAVTASAPERAATAAAELGAGRGVTNVAELVTAEDVDVVHVCTPNHLHAEIAERALAAGKHVVCEKPLATTVDDARALAEQTDGLVTAIPFVYRFYPTVREARSRVRAGEAGPVHLIHGSYLQDWLSTASDDNWRVDTRLGGASRAFADIGVHWCDLVEFVTGERIVALTARTLIAVPERGGRAAVGTEDAVTLLFETDRGALGCLVASQVTPGRKNRLWFSIDGANSSMAFDQELPESLWLGSRTSTALVTRGTDAASPDAARHTSLPAGHPQGYQDAFNSFVRDVYAAVRGEAADGLPTFADGLRAAVLTHAVLDSAANRTWVKVPR